MFWYNTMRLGRIAAPYPNGHIVGVFNMTYADHAKVQET